MIIGSGGATSARASRCATSIRQPSTISAAATSIVAAPASQAVGAVSPRLAAEAVVSDPIRRACTRGVQIFSTISEEALSLTPGPIG